MKFIKKHLYTFLVTIALMSWNVYVLLKVFVLPSAESTVVVQTESSTTSDATAAENAIITDNSYEDENIKIQIDTIERESTTIYVADITLSSPDYLKTLLAQDTYGTNITETTSSMAERANAIFAINGDYYGANSTGYVIKNGVLYRETSRDSDYEDLAIYADGHMEVYNESDVTAQELLDSGVVNTFTFGPTLIKDGEIAVSENDEVGKAMASNPRTAIGVTEDGRYIIMVADGRSDESQGLSLYQLATIMQEYGVTMAYNLDGGGSSTMVFNGQLVNKPTTSGSTIKERAVSDIVYIGY